MTALISACPNQHPVRPGSSFCPTCGAPLELRAPRPAGAPASGYEVYTPAPQTTPPMFGEPMYVPDGIAGERRQDTTRSRRGRWIAAGALVAVLAGGGSAYYLVAGGGDGGSGLDAVGTTTVSGEFVLTDYETATAGCRGQSGYGDIREGATVILTNEDGKILGSTALDSGTADQGEGTCTYTFSVSDVPTSFAQYAVEVTHRGKVVDSRAELEAADWNFFLSMGD